jgi:branched-chain amino acid transport system substrate-binding protein
VRIAAIYAVTGPAAPDNAASLAGVRLAVREVNRSGGVLGRPMALVEIDNRSTPIGSKVAADRAVRQGVTAIVGSAWSSHSLAIARVAEQHGVPMVTNISTHPDVTRIGEWVFRVCFTDPFQGQVMARFALGDLGAKKGLIIKDISSDYSIGLAREFRRNFEAGGGRVVQELGYKHAQDSFRGLLLQARGREPDIVFLPGHDESGAIIREAVQTGMPGTFLGGDGWVTDSFLERGGRLLEKGFYCTHWDENASRPASRSFVGLARGSRGPGAGLLNAPEALAFDAVMLIADALERAGSANREALRRALAETRAWEGVTGSISFDAHGDPIKEAVIMEVERGASRYLKTVAPDGR